MSGLVYWIYYFMLLLTPFWEYPKMPRFGGAFTLIKVVGVIVLLLALLKLLFGERRVYFFRWTEIRLFTLFYVIAAFSAFFIADEPAIAGPLQIYTSAAVSLFAGLVFLDSEARLKTACYVVLFSMLLASYSVLSGFLKYGATRPGGIIGDSNYFALVAVMLLPLAIFLYPVATATQKLILAVAGFAMAGATLLSGSRGGVISLAFCLMYTLLRTRRKALFLVFAAILLAGLVAALPQTGLDRLKSQDSGTEISNQTRQELLRAGWEMIKDKPLLGVGIGMFKPLTPRYNVRFASELGNMGHNTYLEIAAELGIPACLIFLSILYYTWRRAKEMAAFYARADLPVSARIARSFEVGIAAYAVGAVFLSAEYTKQLYMVISFVLALSQLAADREETEQFSEPVEEGQDERTEPQFTDLTS